MCAHGPHKGAARHPTKTPAPRVGVALGPLAFESHKHGHPGVAASRPAKEWAAQQGSGGEAMHGKPGASPAWSKRQPQAPSKPFLDAPFTFVHCRPTRFHSLHAPPFLPTMAIRPSRDAKLAITPSWTSTDIAATLSAVVPVRRTCRPAVAAQCVSHTTALLSLPASPAATATAAATSCKASAAGAAAACVLEGSKRAHTCCIHLASAELRRPMFCSNA